MERRKRAVLCNLQELLFPSPTVYLPYVCGILQAYAEQFDDVRAAWTFGDPVWQMRDPDAMLAEVGEADFVGFSAYVWNVRNSLRLAEAVKTRNPHAFVVFGGPHVPNTASDFLERHPFIDACVHGEGEEAFVGLLRARAAGTPVDRVAGVSVLRDGRQVFTEKGRRLRALDAPSPYLLGLFDDTVARIRALDPHTILMASIETNRGCPYSCAYCDWGMATMSKLRLRDEDMVRRELDWVASHGIDAVVLNDANFGIHPRDVGLMAHAAALKRQTGSPRNFFPTGFAKNNKARAFEINRIIIDNEMDPFGMNVNFSLQATSQETLDAIDRQNIPLENYRRMADLYGRNGYRLTPDLILPLPGETLESFTEGYADLCTWRQVGRVRVYPCMVLPNAPMASPAYREKWGLRTELTRLWRPDPLRRSDPDIAPEYIETVVSTAQMSADEHAQAKVWVHFVNALELYGLTRPLRVHAGRRLGMSARDFYAAMLGWQVRRTGVMAGALASILDGVLEHRYADEVAWAGESETHDGRRLKHHKVLAYDALGDAERFADDLARFAVELGLDDAQTRGVLGFQRDRWVTPAFEPAVESSYRFEYPVDWVAWLDDESLDETPIHVTYARPPLWGGYRAGAEGWRIYALAEAMVDTWCTLGQAGVTVERAVVLS